MPDQTNCCIAWRNWVDEDAPSGTSATALTIGTGSTALTMASPAPLFFVGAEATIEDDADEDRYMTGLITAWNPTTRALTINVATTSGAGSGADWVVTLTKWSLGSWETTLPLTNMGDQRLYKPSRSASAAEASTRFRLDMCDLQTVNMAAILAHTADKNAYWRVRFFEVDAATGALTVKHDSAKDYVWPTLLPFGQYPWGTFPWNHRLLLGDNYQPPGIYLCREQATTTSATSHTIGTGEKTFAAADASGIAVGMPLAIYRSVDPEVGMLGKVTYIDGNDVRVQVTDVESSGTFTDWVIRYTVADAPLEAVRARLVDIQIFNSANADGYVDIGRFFVSPGWFLSVNIQEGGSIQFQDDSPKRRSRGGQPFADPVATYRKTEFTIAYLERDEILSNLYEIQKVQGVRKPILVILDPDDETNLHRLAIYGSLERTSPIRFDPGLLYSCTVNVEEWV